MEISTKDNFKMVFTTAKVLLNILLVIIIKEILNMEKGMDLENIF